MDYEELSDADIGFEVARKRFPDNAVYISMFGKVMVQDPNGKYFCFDINNPSDAWPIIVENKISLHPQPDVNDDWVWKVRTIHTDVVTNKNPLRAAMIVYLMMQEDL